MNRTSAELATLFEGASRADVIATDTLFALLYDELRRLAEGYLRRQGGPMLLGATTLVHELYLRMVGGDDRSFPDRARFFAYASRAMRSLAIDYSRRRSTKKRGSQFELTLDEEREPSLAAEQAAHELEAIGEALGELAALDEALSELVDMHFFGGLSFVEIAELRGVCERTVQRDWKKARLLLHRLMRDGSIELGEG
jgi:RNA polymerase sigma factor (TIGR02999 family)